jgi:predicted transcriptional regulator
MDVQLTKDQEAQLVRIARTNDTNPEQLIKDAIVRLLEEDAHFRAAVREGIAQADRGEFVEELEMESKLEQMLSS